jgi:hypothetical protein
MSEKVYGDCDRCFRQSQVETIKLSAYSRFAIKTTLCNFCYEELAALLLTEYRAVS